MAATDVSVTLANGSLGNSAAIAAGRGGDGGGSGAAWRANVAERRPHGALTTLVTHLPCCRQPVHPFRK
jgi:hypothetical protein